jgi:hypothetical protein
MRMLNEIMGECYEFKVTGTGQSCIYERQITSATDSPSVQQYQYYEPDATGDLVLLIW